MAALSVIGAPTSAGAFGPGQERAPSAFRAHGLLDALRARGLDVVDRGDGRRAEWRTDQRSPEARNVNTVAAVASELADTVAAAFADGHDILVLGGDCTSNSARSPARSETAHASAWRMSTSTPISTSQGPARVRSTGWASPTCWMSPGQTRR